MENVIDIVGRSLPVPQREKLPEGSSAQVVDLADAQDTIACWFGGAFEHVLAACPRWRYSLNTDEMVKAAVKVWMRALVAAGITDKKTVNDGIKRLAASNREYLPTVADFIAMCKDTGEVSKWPCLDAVKKEILLARKPWSTRFVAYVAYKTGSIFHHTTAASERDLAFEREYLLALDLANQGFFDKEEERTQIPYKPDPMVAYYFHLLNSFPHMPDLAVEYLRECKAKGILITVDLEKKTGSVTRVDVSLLGEQVVISKQAAGFGSY